MNDVETVDKFLDLKERFNLMGYNLFIEKIGDKREKFFIVSPKNAKYIEDIKTKNLRDVEIWFFAFETGYNQGYEDRNCEER